MSWKNQCPHRKNSAMIVGASLTILCLASIGPLSAQSTEPVSSGLLGINPLGSHEGGIHLYSASVFGGYYSGGLPGTFGGDLYSATLDDDGITGASANFGWTKATERTRLSGTYSVSYMGHFRYSDLNGFNQSIGLQASRQLGAHWTSNLVFSGGIQNMEEGLFSPTAVGSLAAVPSTFDSLSQAVASGNLSNNQIASLLTGAPILSSPAQVLIFGSRFFYTSALGSLSYARSSRLNITITGGGSRIQHVADPARDAAYPYILPQSTSISASANISYSLTPRTQIAVGISETRTVSMLLDTYNTSSTVFFTRNMSMHWFLEGHLGAARLQILRQTYGLPQGVQYLAGGSIGYKLYGSTLLASYQRFLGDTYGLGAKSSLDFTGSWNWSRPGASWGIHLAGGMQRLGLASLPPVNTWRAMGGVTRRLTSHLSLQMQYGFNSYSGYLGPLYNRTQNAAQVSLVWTPHPVLQVPSRL